MKKASPSISPTQPLIPLSIQAMRNKSYPGSTITFVQTLSDGSNFHQYLTYYYSDGLKIYALLTVPFGTKPQNGWPVIVFNHGYIAPTTYETYPSVGQYATYYPVFSSADYIVFKPDYRGNGNSDGQPEGAYYSPAYATDDLNAIASIKKYKDANPQKIGVWGHSMGGNIALRDMVVNTKDIKAAVIWGGVVGTYTQLSHWHDPSYHPSTYELSLRYRYRQDLVSTYGTPE
ncbi:MAG TPA: alpha/beta fold hydrolase, partial [Patescibacteria group bacterium]|nr:alpha/beta fold hydrolase [Patescibacteria group bacterium]